METLRKYKFDKNLKAQYGKYIVKKFKKKTVAIKAKSGDNASHAISEE